MGSTFQNVVGAILVALMLTVGANIIGNTLIPTDHRAETAGGHAPAKDASKQPRTAEAPKQAAQPSGGGLAQRLAAANVKAGEEEAKACLSCHTFEQGGAHREGPNLGGVVGADIAPRPSFAYSEAMQKKPGEWTYENLDAFLTKPSAFIPGTRETFGGIADAQARANVIAYLRTYSPDAPPLEPGSATQTATPAAAPASPAAVSLAAGDAQAGQAAAKKCAACHSFDQGGAAKVGPNLHGVVGSPMATKEGFKYSDALRGKGGTWSYEALDQFLTKPAAFVPGTKMAFAGVADAKERADIIAYLRSISPNAPPPPHG